MTEAERFIQEKLISSNPIAVNRDSQAKSPHMESDTIELHVPKFLTNSLFSNHRIFWSIVSILVILFIDFAIAPPESVLKSVCYDSLLISLFAPFTFWIPVLLVVKWAWNQKLVRSLMWLIVIWMMVFHLLKISILLDGGTDDLGEFFFALIAFGIGGCGIAAVLWDAIKQKIKIVG